MKELRLLGRERELSVLRELVSTPGGGRVLVVVGEPGIGKTELIGAAASMAQEQGLAVLRTVGMEAEADLPFAGLHQLMGRTLRHADDLPQLQRDALLAAFGLHDAAPSSLFLVAEAVLELLRHLGSGRPVVVVADDVQWLDVQTHEVLTFLAHRAAAAQLIVICAVRTAHPGVLVDAGFPQLTVSGLDDASARGVLAIHAPTLNSEERRRVQAEAMGNPLALLELPSLRRCPGALNATATELSARLEHAFAGRLSALPSATRDAMLVAAVDSSGDIVEILAATAVLVGHPVPSDVIDPAVAVGLIVPDISRLQFRHPLVRSGVLQSEPLRRRQQAHAAVAGVVGDSYRRAWHRAQSIVGPDDAVANELVDTVHVALQRGAVMTAVTNLERAAELTTASALRGHRLLVAAEHAFGMGRVDVVDRLVDAACRTELSELDWARMQWLREIFEDGVPGDAVRVVELCDIALRSSAAGDDDLALNLLMGAALRCWWADSGADARRTVAESVDRLTSVTDDPRHLTALAVAEPVLRGTEVSRRLDGMDLDNVTDANALRLLGMAAHAIGDSVRATDLLDRAEVLLRERSLLGLLPHVLGMQAFIRTDLGDWEAAEDAAREVAQLARETGQSIWSLNTQIGDARTALLKGDAALSMKLLTGAEFEAARRGLNDTLCLLFGVRGLALLVLQRPQDAYACLRRLYHPGDPAYHLRESFGALGHLAEAAREAGMEDDARDVIEGLTPLLRVTPSSMLRVQLAYATAVLAPPRGATAAFRAARRIDLTRWPWVQARLDLAEGRHLASRGEVTRALAKAQQALTYFEAVGARPWAEQSRRLSALVQPRSVG